MQDNRVHVGEDGLEVEQLARACGPETVDRLRVVANDRDTRIIAAERAQDVDLQGVDVLVLIDKYVIERSREAWTECIIEQCRPVPQQQIVKVEQAKPTLAFDVG